MRPAAVGGRRLDLVDDVHAFDNLAEDRIAISVGLRVVESRVVNQVYEKLRARRIGIAAARHCQRAAFVLQAVATLEWNRAASRLFLHVGGESTALNHESRN